MTASMASTKARGTVLLLKAPRDSDDDPYVETLTRAGYRAMVVAVLSFHFVNQGPLASALGNASNYSGIVFTSVRAVQAVNAALTSHGSSGVHFQPHSLRCFVVGQTTASAAREALFQPEGEDAGNAEKLAEFIVDAVSKEEKRPLLYPCAQMRRDTLLDTLTSNGCNVEEVIAYETVPNEGIKEAIMEAFSTEAAPDSVVYFSPSGVQFTQSLVQEGVLPLQSMQVYALGPATEQALVSRCVPIAGVAAKPDPTSLLHMLQR